MVPGLVPKAKNLVYITRMNKFNSIFIANMAEIARPLARLMETEERKYEIYEDHALCDRFIFSQNDNRVLVTPLPLDRHYFQDTVMIMKFKNIINLSPQSIGESLCESIIHDKKLLHQLIGIIADNPGIIIHSDGATGEFLKFVGFLKSKGLHFQTPELPITGHEWLVNFFDSKSGFRQATATLGTNFPPMPEGFIVENRDELVGFCRYLLKKAGGFVMKSNRGWSGAGLKIVTKKELLKIKLEKFIQNLISSEEYWQKDLIVVEELIRADTKICGGSPSVEFVVGEDGPKALYVCGMRVNETGMFKGVEIGKASVPKYIEKELFRSGLVYAKLLYKMGYRGYFDIDWVNDKKGKLYPLESNIRRTGGTHVYDLSNRLFGREWAKNHYIVANNLAGAPNLKGMTYSECKNVLKSVLYPIKGKNEGVILTVTKLLNRGNIGYVVVGPDKKTVSEIEEKLIRKIEK